LGRRAHAQLAQPHRGQARRRDRAGRRPRRHDRRLRLGRPDARQGGRPAARRRGLRRLPVTRRGGPRRRPRPPAAHHHGTRRRRLRGRLALGAGDEQPRARLLRARGLVPRRRDQAGALRRAGHRGALQAVARATLDRVIVDYAVYEGGHRVEEAIPLDELHERSQANHGFAWIGLFEPTADEFDSVAGEFDLHPLAVEDAITAHQRPKLDRYGDSLLLVLKTARWDAEAVDVSFGEVLLFIGDDFIISVRHGELDLHGVRRQLESQPDILDCGPSAVLYAIVDSVVDGYEPVVEALDASIS